MDSGGDKRRMKGQGREGIVQFAWVKRTDEGLVQKLRWQWIEDCGGRRNQRECGNEEKWMSWALGE